MYMNIYMYIRQVTRAKSKSGAVVKHQRMFVVFKKPHQIQNSFLRAALHHSTALSLVISLYMCIALDFCT